MLYTHCTIQTVLQYTVADVELNRTIIVPKEFSNNTFIKFRKRRYHNSPYRLPGRSQIPNNNSAHQGHPIMQVQTSVYQLRQFCNASVRILFNAGVKNLRRILSAKLVGTMTHIYIGI